MFVAEGMASDTGRCVDWLHSLGMFDDVADTSDIAETVSGLYLYNTLVYVTMDIELWSCVTMDMEL